jgi:hypothetical protein
VNARRKNILLLLTAIFLPAKMFACAACGSANGQIDSPLADGMNLGILTLMVFIGTVLAGSCAFFIRILRRSEALAAAEHTPTISLSKT